MINNVPTYSITDLNFLNKLNGSCTNIVFSFLALTFSVLCKNRKKKFKLQFYYSQTSAYNHYCKNHKQHL